MRASSDKARARSGAAIGARAVRTGRGAGLGPLLEFAAAMATGDAAGAARALRRARAAGASRVAAEETALMLMLYAGYPAALEGLRVAHAEWPGRSRASDAGAPRRWRASGERLCRRVYGPNTRRLIENVRALHPDLATWMIEHGYGRVLSRAGMPARDRELCSVTVLAALGWERQLHSHLLGARRLGAPLAEVRRACDLGRRRAPAGRRASVRRAWRAAFAAPPRGGMAAPRRRLTTPRRGT